MFNVACSVGFASCKTFGKQPKHLCFGRSPKAGRRDASPRILPLSRGKGARGIGIENLLYFISCLQLEISCIYSVYSPFEFILGNIKSSLIVLVLLHTLFRQSLCLFGTVNIYLVCPLKRLGKY